MAQQLVGCHYLARQMQWSSVVEATRPCDEDWPIDGGLVDLPDEGTRMTMKRLEEKAAFCHAMFLEIRRVRHMGSVKYLA